MDKNAISSYSFHHTKVWLQSWFKKGFRDSNGMAVLDLLTKNHRDRSPWIPMDLRGYSEFDHSIFHQQNVDLIDIWSYMSIYVDPSYMLYKFDPPYWMEIRWSSERRFYSGKSHVDPSSDARKKGLGHLCPEKWFTSLNSWGDHFQQIRLFRWCETNPQISGHQSQPLFNMGDTFWDN